MMKLFVGKNQQFKNIHRLCHRTTSNKSNEKKADYKGFEQIPGPNGFLGIGTFYHYFPIIGEFIVSNLIASKADKSERMTIL